jgi:cytochrome c-type biogenesis protein CcmH/NrfG
MEIRFLLIQGLVRGLRQPEYVHVLLNPVPVYGLLISWIGLIIAAVSKSRRAQVVALLLVFVSSLSAWPVYEFGQQAYDRVLSMTDEDGERWLDEHQDRAEDLIRIFYALAVLSAAAIAVPIKWPKYSAGLVIAVILLGTAALGCGSYIAYAGGKIRHREFRNEPAPPKRPENEHD